ncbi:MAG TPA: Dabb family protein [Pirellulales bacterium]|jgi:hypothetical protein
MKKLIALLSLSLFAFSFAIAWQARIAKSDDAKEQKNLSHNIYFSLADPTPENKQRLIEACNKYLAPHPGVLYFATGTICEEKGMFADRDYDVALVMTFKDRKALGVYARTPEHQRFVAETTPLFKKVRIFDADVTRVAVPDDKPAK